MLIHEPSLCKIEETKPDYGSHNNGYYGFPEMWSAYPAFEPASLRLNFQLLELHVCKYVDTKMCKYSMFISGWSYYTYVFLTFTSASFS